IIALLMDVNGDEVSAAAGVGSSHNHSAITVKALLKGILKPFAAATVDSSHIHRAITGKALLEGFFEARERHLLHLWYVSTIQYVKN
ncbi:hypothetical protein NL526_28600, partial [Klebsiella pneumoniae]|nr:hypothetical protein [Klebsiella pneumoniae]